MDDTLQYQRARRRAHQLRAFYSSLGSFVVVNIVLLVINIVTDPHSLWFYWVTIFWGIALLWQAYGIFWGQHRFGQDWEDRKTREIMEKDNRS